MDTTGIQRIQQGLCRTAGTGNFAISPYFVDSAALVTANLRKPGKETAAAVQICSCNKL
jgi:hypothetical protein